MDTSLILILVLTFAFAATRLEREILGDRSSRLASLEYLLIGVLVGPLVLGLLDQTRLDSLEPLLAVVTGFAGFLVGLPLSFRQVAARPRGSFRFAVGTGVITAGLIGGLAFVFFSGGYVATLGIDGLEAVLIGAATLGLGASITSGDAIAEGVLAARADGPVSRILPAAARTIRVLAILGFGLALASYRGRADADEFGIPVYLWNLIAITSGVGFGIIFHVFVGNERDQKKLFVATIGIVALGSGIADALHFSPLFINLVAGATIANLSKATPELLAADERLRRPVIVVLLLLAGASWTPIPALLWIVPAAFIILRIVALRVAARTAVILLDEVDSHTPGLGMALLSQGALVAAVAVNYRVVVGDTTLSNAVFTTLLLSAVVNELYASRSLRRVLENAGESGRRPKTMRIRRPGRKGTLRFVTSPHRIRQPTQRLDPPSADARTDGATTTAGPGSVPDDDLTGSDA